MPRPTIHSHIKAGTCPHGLPLGACPICNGMAGGNSTTKRDIPRNVGEMTYNQCAAIGAMLKAQKHAKEQAKLAQQNHIEALKSFNKNLEKTHQRLQLFNSFINNNFPKIISLPTNIILNTISLGLKLIQNLPTFINNTFNTLQQKLCDISDKLVAIYGEIETSIKDKISTLFIKLKSKFKFIIDNREDIDDKDKEFEEEKRIFDLKFVFNKITKHFTKKDNHDNEHNKTE